MTIGDKLRQTRKHQGRTLEDVSKEAGMSLPHLSDIERDAVAAPLKTLLRIAAALRVEPLALFVGTEGFGGSVDDFRFNVDGQTPIATAGGQTIAMLTNRVCSRVCDVFEQWDESAEKHVREVLYAVYQAGYQRGALSSAVENEGSHHG